MTGQSKHLGPQWYTCPVPYCLTKSENRKGFIGIPENPKRRQEWLDACGMKSCAKYQSICIKHFKFMDFQNELGFGRLKRNVCPSQFPPTFVSQLKSYQEELSAGVLGGEAVVDNSPEVVTVPLYHGDPPEEIIIHNESSNPHDYTPHKVTMVQLKN